MTTTIDLDLSAIPAEEHKHVVNLVRETTDHSKEWWKDVEKSFAIEAAASDPKYIVLNAKQEYTSYARERQSLRVLCEFMNRPRSKHTHNPEYDLNWVLLQAANDREMPEDAFSVTSVRVGGHTIDADHLEMERILNEDGSVRALSLELDVGHTDGERIAIRFRVKQAMDYGVLLIGTNRLTYGFTALFDYTEGRWIEHVHFSESGLPFPYELAYPEDLPDSARRMGSGELAKMIIARSTNWISPGASFVVGWGGKNARAGLVR